MFNLRKKNHTIVYDRKRQEPLIRASICNGEKVAGFLDKSTGSFHEVTVIGSDADLEEFKKHYGIDGEIRVVY